MLDHLGQAAAALIVPYLPLAGITPDRGWVMTLQAQAAQRMSDGIGGPA